MNETVKAYADPNHVGNSAKHYTGKQCIEKGCEAPAGTKWSPLWCFEHNVQRIDRISASLEDIVQQMSFSAALDKATESLGDMLTKEMRLVRALIIKAGGKVTITPSDLAFKILSEGVSYDKDGTEHWRILSDKL